MKKDKVIEIIIVIILFILLIGLWMWLRSNEEKREQKSQPYLTEKAVEALNQGDFNAAYGAIDKMKAQKYYKEENNEEIDKLNDRIVQNEIASIMDEYEGKKAYGKIIFVINERTVGSNKEAMIKTALNMSESLGDEELYDKLLEYQSESSGEE